MRYFVAVAEELNFRRAAERLRISQPTLSTQIRQLEEFLGVVLLDRDTQRVEMTSAGAEFLEECRRLLREVDGMVLRVQQSGIQIPQRLSIGFVASLGHGFMPLLLRSFHQQFPDVLLRLQEMDTSQQTLALRDGRLDLSFMGLGQPTDFEDLRMEMVVSKPLLAFLPFNHPLAAEYRKSKCPLPLKMLSREAFVLAARATAPLYNPWLIVLCQRTGFQPQIYQESGQPTTVLNYVAAGLGVTILPAQFADLRTAGTMPVPLAAPIPYYQYFAAYSQARSNPLIEAIIQLAKTLA